MKSFFKVSYLAAVVSSCCIASLPVLANQDEAIEKSDIEQIVVTGRAGAGFLRKSETSYAISTLSDEDLVTDNPLSVADVLKTVPGFWVESSGGEAGNNIRARGIPRDGYSSVSLQENGLAIQHDGGLGYLNADQSFRLDETIERVEVVRGGPSPIFASNAPGGMVNFITRKAYDYDSAVMKFELGDYNHYRFDGYYGKALKNDMFVSVGGFYRQNDGVRDPGFTSNQGGQLRISAGKRFDNGEVFVDYKHLNDKVAFLLPIPLSYDANGDITDAPGFDANYGTMMGPEVAHNVYRNLGDGYDFDLTDGTHTELNQFTVKADFTLDNGWQLANNFRYRQSDTLRNGLFPTGGITSAQQRIDDLSAQYGSMLPQNSHVELAFTNHPNEVFNVQNNQGNGQVLNGNLLSVFVPLDEVINDLRFSKQFTIGDQQHDISFGAYVATYDYEFVRYMATAMFEVAEQARLVDAVVVNDAGEQVGSITENGILRYGSLYNNVDAGADIYAFYAADEWQITPQLRLDLGGRYEVSELSGTVEGTEVVDLEASDTFADDNFITGNGEFKHIDREYKEFAWTAGINYQLSDELGYFARYTDSFRAPNASDFNGNPDRDDLKVEPITMFEAGVKYAADDFSVYATPFYTHFENMRFTDYIFDTTTNSYRDQTAYGDTKTYGVELESFWQASELLDFALTGTWQAAEYENFNFTNQQGEAVDFGGNQLIRVPELSYRGTVGINLLDGRFRTELVAEYYGDRYGDVANTVNLPSYHVFNLSARYDINDEFVAYFNVQNINNEIGLTEGNPRGGQFIGESNADDYFLARPILGRTISASLRYSF
ncbi:TonB-dependent receptor [Pseudoalteromonas sp. bablab_jr010]|uniref:TonB-dependent receptor n=1 Tax=Pseudoalteromonas sp. bablab_jr010 TaxID=2755063 RepID=UPI0018F2B357|nr:TonB-dependent receptor [Pseudoalteromonas sp. bablab_jr010]